MNKKKIGIITLIIGVLLISTGVFLSKNGITFNLSQNVNNIEKVIKTFYSDSSTELEINQYTQSDVISKEIPIGKESYLKRTYNIKNEKYNKIQKKYSKKIENYILSKFKYTIQEKKEGIVEVKFKSYNYYSFVSDLDYLKEYLLQLGGISNSMIYENPEEYSEYSYKAMVKAMTIMYSYLDDYNDSKEKTIKINFNSDNINTEYKNLFEALIQEKNFSEENDEKVLKILEKAIKDGIIDINNPLNIS